MAKKDYYDILGVKKDDSIETIKKNYKKLALKYHPDKVQDDKKKEYEEKFKEINEAYSILGDEEKRKVYESGGGSYAQEEGFGGSNINDLLRNLFNRGGFGEESEDDGELRYEINLEFKEAVFGCEKEVSIKRNIICESCKGSGAEGNQTQTCYKCNGHGRLNMEQDTPWGRVRQAVTCDECYGSGQIPKVKCHNCHGAGIVLARENVKFKIPAGIDDGQAMRIKNGGNAIRKNLVGDLLLYIRVKPDNLFKREEFDVHLEVSISFSKAALGGEISIPTLSGENIKVKIKKGIDPGSILRLKGKGIAHLNNPNRFGDQYTTIKISTPKNLTNAQTKLFEELSKLD